MFVCVLVPPPSPAKWTEVFWKNLTQSSAARLSEQSLNRWRVGSGECGVRSEEWGVGSGEWGVRREEGRGRREELAQTSRGLIIHTFTTSQENVNLVVVEHCSADENFLQLEENPDKLDAADTVK